MGRAPWYDRTCRVCGKDFQSKSWHAETCSTRCRKQMGHATYKNKAELSHFENLERRKDAFIAAQHLFWIKKHLPDEVARFRASRAWSLSRGSDSLSAGSSPPA